MIRTSYRICVETAQDCADALDVYALAQIFKCAPAQQVTVPNCGLPESAEELATGLESGEGSASEAAAEASDTVTEGTASEATAETSETVAEDTTGDTVAEDAVAALGKEAAKEIVSYVTTRGKKISAAAMNTYRETMAMRQAFGIAKEKRTNIDTVLPGGLARILAEPVIEANCHTTHPRPLPKTQRAAADEAQAKWPRVLPALGLRTSILHRPMWSAEDPVARQNWKKVVLPQTINEVHELQRDILRLEAPTGMDPRIAETLRFERLDLRFDRFTVSIKNRAINRFANVGETLPLVYEAVNGPVLGACEIARIDIPYIDYEAVSAKIRAEIEAELEAGADAEAKREPTDKSGGTATTDAVEENIASACDDTNGDTYEDTNPDGQEEPPEEEPPSREQGIEALHLAEQSISSIRATELSVFAPRSKDEESQAPATANSHIWGIIMLDGSLHYYDSKAGAFCEKPAAEQADSEPDADGAAAECAAKDVAAARSTAATRNPTAERDSQSPLAQAS